MCQAEPPRHNEDVTQAVSAFTLGMASGVAVAAVHRDRKPRLAEKIITGLVLGFVSEAFASGASFGPAFGTGYAGFAPTIRNEGFKVENVVLASLGACATWSVKFGRGK